MGEGCRSRVVRSEALTTVTGTSFRDMTPCSLIHFADVSEEHISIVRVDESGCNQQVELSADADKLTLGHRTRPQKVREHSGPKSHN